MPAGPTVSFEGAGRAGDAEYREPGLCLALWWELLADGAWIWAPAPAEWDDHWRARGAGGAVGRRAEILGRVAREAVRQKAPGARASVDDRGVRLVF